jgi:exopolysaccharide biosynthesis WecB/TagA/CpsF family protein
MPAAKRPVATGVRWPRKYDLFGVKVSGTNYDEALDALFAAAEQREPAIVSLTAVHAVVTASCTPDLRDKMNRFAIIGPDGQPVRWALNWLYGLGLTDRVYGPEMTLRICRRAAETGLPIYLYGGSPETLQALSANLQQRFPGLVVAGAESPPFRPLTPEEDQAVIERINSSGAAIVFIGLGHPKQDLFAAAHADSIHAVQVCVGAAFDFHAGSKKSAPAWMQKRGLEWLFRLCQEPRRLFRRYFETNSIFVLKFLRQYLASFFRRAEATERESGGHHAA